MYFAWSSPAETLEDATNSIEELEETAKLFLMLRGLPTQYLTNEQCADLLQRYPT
jgi:hypothetical protein